jgi:cytochrome bd-type quinol oxidase subunit 2
MSATAVVMFPVMLRSISDPASSLLADGAANTPKSLKIALWWWAVGIPLVIVYFAIQFRIHAGKAVATRESEGY